MSEISIIIPCYNVEKYLSRCLDSIFNQTISNHLLEIILINDCSKDHTWEIISEYESMYPELIIAINCPEKIPTGSVRNIGLSYATGTYIMFIDSDDFIIPPMIESLYTTISHHHLDVVECSFQIFSRENELQVTDLPTTIEIFDNITIEQRSELIKKLSSRSTVWGKILSASFIHENRIHFCDTGNGDDGFFAALCTVFMKKYAFIDCPLYCYFINTNGIMWNKEGFDSSSSETVKAQILFANYMTKSEKNAQLYNDLFYEFEYVAITKMLIDSSSRYYSFFHSFQSNLLMKCFIELSQLYPNFFENPYFKERLDFIEIINNVIQSNLPA